jgi:hypothetical protein
MAVRRKLDLAGVKLKLQHWSELDTAECATLLAWPDDPGAIERLREHPLELPLRREGWAELNELQRFALVKLSHPGHEHRNLPRALAEFGLIEPGQQL